ncbi:superoxide dismutase [Cu-Zn]-like [Argopecten irradians]|uniref:superoxide dismutase [Cu-Zn]-like n=1 Tax=Argopecten irradians TaxID=31199 RepID=UPI003722F7B0
MLFTLCTCLAVVQLTVGQFQPPFVGPNINPGPRLPGQGGFQPVPVGPMEEIGAVQGRQPPGFQPNRIVAGADLFVYGTCYFNESGSNIRGRVDFQQGRTGGPTRVRVQVVGLPPSLMSDTEHGIHIHEYGDIGRGCYATGPHFDSDTFSFHGSPNNLGTGNAHEGDMGNLRQSNAGVIDSDLVFPLMNLLGDTGVLGRAVVLHEGRDDLGRGGNSMSLQTGNSGAPLACCVIAWSDSTNWNNPFIARNANTFNPNQGANQNFQNNGFQQPGGQFQGNGFSSTNFAG